MQLYLRDDVEKALRGGALGLTIPSGALIAGDLAETVFEALFNVAGDIYRHTERRRTLRCRIGERAYFAKLHNGVGWYEIAKNLLSLKRPVLGARNERDACRRLRARGVFAPDVAAFGVLGGNPAKRRSFVVCDALDGFTSLEDVGNSWVAKTPSTRLKRQLVVAAGEIAGRIHAAGVIHRDFYICHLLANTDKLARGEVELAVIDLHRASASRRTSRRARRRDLAALRYSAAEIGLARTDLLRFVAAYAKTSPAPEMRRHRRFWAAVSARAERLRHRAVRKGLATGARALTQGATQAASIARLADLGREPPLPFRFDVDLGDGGRRLLCTETLRTQPGRRLVARAGLGTGQDIVVKAFFGRHGKRDWRREQRGIAALAAAGARVPRLLGVGTGAGAHVLAFEHVGDARVPGPAEADAVLAVLAGLHAGGVRQRDLHVGNFLARCGKVFAIDGGRVRRGPVGRAAGLRDVARLLAQLPQDSLCLAGAAGTYASARGWALTDVERRRLPVLVAAARRRSVSKLIAKTVRDCTPFSVRLDARRLVAVARGDDDPALRAVIDDPERALATGHPLKRGNTATVVRAGGLVIKRYSIKSRRHRWRLKVRASRARRAWQIGHGLGVLGVPTARPRALIEQRGTEVGDAAGYLVLDYVDGTPLGQAIDDAGATPALMAAVRGLFLGLRLARLGHGDMKASNFIVADNRVHVVDLDAARFLRSAGGFRHRHRRDIARFLRNWGTAPESLTAALRQAVSADFS